MIFLVIPTHYRELGPVDHAQLVDGDTKGERDKCINLVLGVEALFRIAHGNIGGPLLASDFLP